MARRDDFTGFGRRRLLQGTAAGSVAFAISGAAVAARSRETWSVHTTYSGDGLAQVDASALAGGDARLWRAVRVSVEGFDPPRGAGSPERIALEMSGGAEGADAFQAFVWDGDRVAGESRPVSFVAPVYEELGGMELTVVIDGRHRVPVVFDPGGLPGVKLRVGRYRVSIADARGMAISGFEIDVAAV